MKLRMAENSLFAILLRKPWWVSALTAVVLLAIAGFALPPAWFPFTAPIALPFVVIAGIVGWRVLQLPSAARVAAIDAAVRAMSWNTFANALEQAWRREGWGVERVTDPAVDLQLTKGWRRGVVAGRRWKVARLGVEPLRELQAARERLEAHDAIWIAVGEISEQASRYAQQQGIRLVGAADLARMLPAPARGPGSGLRRSPS